MKALEEAVASKRAEAQELQARNEELHTHVGALQVLVMVSGCCQGPGGGALLATARGSAWGVISLIYRNHAGGACKQGMHWCAQPALVFE